jgi:ethanolamine ammonia-lyase small subunit
MADVPARPKDPFARLRGATPARIGLARSGQALTTPPMLELQLAEARARAAVFTELDVAGLQAALGDACVVVKSAAESREIYLRRPHLGRTLAPGAPPLRRLDIDLAIVIADGLSAAAANSHAAPLVHALTARLTDWRVGPVILALHGRVAIGDPIGEALGARAVLVLIGERPGLSAADSLSAYLTWAPKTGRLDSERNCVSNVRPEGLETETAADKITWLLTEARRLGFTGVELKDRAGSSLTDSVQDRRGPSLVTEGIET